MKLLKYFIFVFGGIVTMDNPDDFFNPHVQALAWNRDLLGLNKELKMQK